ncbi:unnamed protein product [Caenorhabditis angaria]|uniref:Uncharacterized protein n=1 Tax=Caenorhabditis angaria TaxID=860376 RepID=A0A9P1ICJ2_9PELO|nr:unnamed protein product [Caenorhabditis angaria]
MFLRSFLSKPRRTMRLNSYKASGFEKVANYENIARSFFQFEQNEKDNFRPKIIVNSRQGSHSSAYGGLVFAQALSAAENTVENIYKPHSVHSFFILSVDTKEPIEYKVKRARDGKSFATRTVEAIQKEKTVFVLQASFHVDEPQSIVHQCQMPDVPAPETLMSMRDAVPYMKNMIENGELTAPAAILNRLKKYETQVYTHDEDLFEMRPTNLAKYFGHENDRKPSLYIWMRARGDVDENDERLHRLLIAYNSDSSMITAATTPHYAEGFKPSMLFSLDHCVWFHRGQMKADDWLLFEVISDVASGSRASSHGRIWSRDGILVASCHQESLIRTKGIVSML